MKQPHASVNPEKTEQDNGWKELLDGFFKEFIKFFFPAVYTDVDWQRGYEFLDKERAQLGREHATGKRIADKLVRVWLKDGRETWLLIHVEVQGRPEARFNERTYVYNYRIFDKHNCEVISLVVVTGRGGARVGKFEIARWGFRLLCEFPVARITDYRGHEAELLEDSNPFAMVVLTQLKWLEAKGNPQKRLAAKRELMRSLRRSGYDRKYAIGLLRFLDWVIVLPPELEQQLKYELEEEKKTMPYVTSWERMGIVQGKRELVLHLLRRKLGELDAKVQARLEQLPVEKLEQLGEALLSFTEPQDLEKWLRRRTRARKRG